MKRVGAREFKNRLGQYLREVRKGRSLLITDRGRPVAKVSPPEENRPEKQTIQERLEELEAQGLIRLGRGRLRPFRPVPGRGKPISEMIIEDRR